MVGLAPYHAVFMDCEMPEMDGYAATAEIRRRHSAEEGHPRLPIIAMTAKVGEGNRAQCLAAGMDDYIAKPVRLEELEAALKRWVPEGAREDWKDGLPLDPATTSVQACNGPCPDRSNAPCGPALDVATVERLRSLAAATDPSVLTGIFEAFLESARDYL